MQARTGARWRWHIKQALASTIARAHSFGLASALARSRRRPLVLGYHRVVGDYAAIARSEMPSMLIGARMFARHLDSIGRHFRFTTLDDIGDHIREGRPFDTPVAAVTFDDGYGDVYDYAFPILKRKGIPGAVFVVTDLVGRPFWQVHDRLYHLVAKAFATWGDPRRQLCGLMRDLGLPVDHLQRSSSLTRTPLVTVSALLPGLAQADVRRLMEGIEASVGNGFHDVPRTLNWNELREMRRGGITIGSHTRSHVSLPAEAADVIDAELTGSKQQLEEQLGESIRHFAYPGGQFNQGVVRAVARAGYDYAYTACQHGEPDWRTLTIERLLLWEGSSVDADGRFSDEILTCQAQDLWPPSWRCERVHAHG